MKLIEVIGMFVERIIINLIEAKIHCPPTKQFTYGKMLLIAAASVANANITTIRVAPRQKMFWFEESCGVLCQ